jgi:hypothetical protein
MSYEKLLASLQAEQEGVETLPSQEGAGEDPPMDGDGDEDDMKKKKKGGGDDLYQDNAGPAAGEDMAKAIKVTMENGEQVDALDATDLIKSLNDRLEAVEGASKSVPGLEGVMTKAVELITSQGALIKSLHESVAALSSQGRGRKAVVSLTEKPGGTLVKSDSEDGVSAEVFFAKAEAAQREGRITSLDISTAEACLNRGTSIPVGIIQRVMAPA